MSRFRKIDVRIWNDQKFRSLSDDGKLAFLLVLTHPSMTALGALPAHLSGLAQTLKWLPERFAKAFGELSSNGMAKGNDDDGLVWLPNFLRYNPPENPNVVKAWEASVDMLPECELKNEVMAMAYESLRDRPKSFAEAFAKWFGEPLAKPFPNVSGNRLLNHMPNQEQEPEQEPEQEQEPKKIRSGSENLALPHAHVPAHSPAREGSPPHLFDRFAAAEWIQNNSKLKPGHPKFAQCLDLIVDGDLRWSDLEVAA